jgi:rhodanese-related sulfurtransferase
MELESLRNYLKNVNDTWNYITPTDFYKEYFLKKRSYYLVDLRHASDFKRGHIPYAKNIYWLDILNENNIKKLPLDKPIFLICYVGHTSSQIMTLLKMLGYNVIAIKFGYGISPVQGVPVAGWSDYGFPTVSS